jgi:hypothetical protein
MKSKSQTHPYSATPLLTSLIRSLSRVLSLFLFWVIEKRGRKDWEDEEREKKRRGGREEGAVDWWVLRERGQR